MDTQTKPRLRTATLAGGALAALLSLTACGAGSDDGGGDSGAEETAAETTAAADAAPAEDLATIEGAAAAFLDNGIEDLIVAILVDQDFNAAADAADPYWCSESVAEIRAMGDSLAAMTEEERAAAMGELGELESDEFTVEYEILGSTEEGDTGTVEVELTSPNPLTGEVSTETTDFDMAKEEGQWQLCGAFF
ncbi:hypothetical protein [Glycomyces tenuis]|uniref:hypothetical protein n=1 Tax=Glycomyces tenuis TaxID=58116 RepID=UPI00040631B8|nr:hypothetical protein [Glycomyces tenuis]